MGVLYDCVEGFFQEDGWPIQSLPDQGVLTTSYTGVAGGFSAMVRVDESQKTVTFATLYHRLIHPQARVRVLEFITRANFGLPLGCFTFELDGGEVQFRTSIDIDGFELTTALIRNLVYTNCLAMDAYAPGLAMVLAGDTSPERAIEIVEANP